jgi:hypothetical protein
MGAKPGGLLPHRRRPLARVLMASRNKPGRRAGNAEPHSDQHLHAPG